MSALFYKIREKYYETLNMFRQIRLDKKYERMFLRVIREETADPRSEFVTKWNLKLGDDRQSIIYITNVPLEVQQLHQDFLIQDKLNENTYFVTDFIEKACHLHNYIGQPEYYHIEDPSAKSDEVSLMYLAEWRFHPMIDSNMKRRLYTTVAGIGAALAGSLSYVGWLLLF